LPGISGSSQGISQSASRPSSTRLR
jgi:hypothetical protein